MVAAPVAAAGPGSHPPQPAKVASGSLGVLWHSLMTLFAPQANWAKNGSIMDPNGLTATACLGSIMDPDGCPGTGAQAGARTDSGSIMDPDG
jgi:hypothetical protein